MQAFDYHPVTSVSEAVALLAQGSAGACLLNGGTDLLAQLKEGRRTAAHVVDLKRIPELAEFRLIAPEKLKAWDFGTGLAVSGWLAGRAGA